MRILFAYWITSQPMSKAAKKAVNLTLDSALLQAARAHDINLSATLETAIATELRLRQRAEWISRNGAAIAAYNEDVEASGTFSDGQRSF